MSKKILVVLLVMAMLVTVFVGCNTKDNVSTNDTEGSESEGEKSSDESSDDKTTDDGEGQKIVIVTSPSGVDDGSFNQNNYEGAKAFVDKNADSSLQDVRETDVQNSVPTVEGLVGEYDVIITPGFQFGGITQVATDNPDKKFILIDSFPVALEEGGDAPVLDNVYAVQFKEQEAGFYAGIAAALETKTGKVAVVNGIAYPSNVNYQFGFEAGVAYAVKNLSATAEIVELKEYAGTDVTETNVGGNYIGTFDDEAKGKIVGKALIDEGVDVMLVAAGGSGNGVFSAAKEDGKTMIIGCDVDQYDDGVNGSSNIILTSVLKVMDYVVENSLNDIASGKFKGGNYTLGVAEGGTGFVKAEGRHQMSDETVKVLDDVLEKIKSGEILPPSNFSKETVESFPGL